MSPFSSRVRPSPTPFEPRESETLNSKIPLKKSTVKHLRQAIREQSQGMTQLLRSEGSSILIHKSVDTAALTNATNTIKAHLDDVLRLEIFESQTAGTDNHQDSTFAVSQTNRRAGSPAHGIQRDGASGGERLDLSEFEWQYSNSSGPNGNEGNGPESQSEYILDDIQGIQTATNNSYRSPKTDGLSTDKNDESEALEGSEEVDANISVTSGRGHESTSSVDKVQTAATAVGTNAIPQNTIGQDSRSQTPTSAKARSESPQAPPKTPSPRKPGVFSKLAPSRLLNIFLPTPSPTPSKPSQPAAVVEPASSLPPTPIAAAAERSSVYNFKSVQVPAVTSSSNVPSPTIIEDLLPLPSLSEDELLSPLPTSVSVSQKLKTTHQPHTLRSSNPPRRSARTTKPRTSTRLAQMIPPNLRTAGSMGPHKTLPGPRMNGGRDGGERGRSVIPFSSVRVGEKRSGSASSVSSTGSERTWVGGGGGRVKRLRFEGIPVR